VVRSSVSMQLPERARRAVQLWQSGGGHLVILVDDESGAWRNWLADGAGDFVSVGASREIATGEAFAGLPAFAELSGLGVEEIAIPAGQLQARTITPTPAAEASGWRTHYTLADGSTVAASGPVGLGFVSMIGFDPARAVAVRSRTSAAVAWAAVLDRVLKRSAPDEDRFNIYSAASGSGTDESRAIDTLVNAGVHGEGIGMGSVLSVLGVLVAFVLAIGPVDALVLRRLRLRHWSWLSALVWVGLASLLAVKIPSLTVGGRTSAGRLAMTDAVLDSEGQAVASWTTALTAIYAGRTGAVGPDDARPGAAWRGVSPLELWQWDRGQETSALGTLRLVQRPEVAPGGARETLTPVALSQRGWTARALLDVSPDLPPVRARIIGGDDSILTLLPAEAGLEIIAARVTVGGRRWILNAPPGETPIELSAADGRAINPEDASGYDWVTGRDDFEWEALADLAGAPNRARALRDWTSGSRFALVEILYSTSSPSVEIRGADAVMVRGAVRLAVPIATPFAEPDP